MYILFLLACGILMSSLQARSMLSSAEHLERSCNCLRALECRERHFSLDLQLNGIEKARSWFPDKLRYSSLVSEEKTLHTNTLIL